MPCVSMIYWFAGFLSHWQSYNCFRGKLSYFSGCVRSIGDLSYPCICGLHDLFATRSVSFNISADIVVGTMLSNASDPARLTIHLKVLTNSGKV